MTKRTPETHPDIYAACLRWAGGDEAMALRMFERGEDGSVMGDGEEIDWLDIADATGDKRIRSLVEKGFLPSARRDARK